jgi:hypothetical protein
MGNYLSHTVKYRFEPELTLCQLARFRVVDCYHCQNLQEASLPMHCFYCILTSLISQALLQAALDKEERDFTSWFFQYEFLKFTSVRGMEKHSDISCNASATIDWQPQWEALAQTQAYQVG